jgi:hypothetical protein
MVRGVLIFTTGVTVGYAAAMRNQEPNGEIKAATRDFIVTMKNILADAWLDTKNEIRAEKAKEKGESVGEGTHSP